MKLLTEQLALSSQNIDPTASLNQFEYLNTSYGLFLSQLSESGLKSVVRLVLLELQLYAHIATARCIFFSERRLVASYSTVQYIQASALYRMYLRRYSTSTDDCTWYSSTSSEAS